VNTDIRHPEKGGGLPSLSSELKDQQMTIWMILIFTD